ncbi:MAG: MaoC family dehydratase [Microthrixaceae bacterium]
MTTTVSSPGELLSLIGQDLGHTAWSPVTQDEVNLFADATGDHQWIHVDVERAKAESPFGGPIAHGYLTLSLVNRFLPELLDVQGASMGVNVGLDKVRFPSPVPTGSRLRGHGLVVSVEEAKGGFQITVRVTIEVDGSDKPCCVADTVSRFFP